MTRFIIETDLGHDPDDFLTICHLLAAGHEIVAMSLVPGAPGQVNLANLIRKRTGQDFSIGVAKEVTKQEHLGVHERIMDRHGVTACVPDGGSANIVASALDTYPDVHVLVIGPGVGLEKAIVGRTTPALTFQGGFLPYSRHVPQVRLDKFEGKEAVPTFNFNGARGAVDAVLGATIGRRQFVGKNICHTLTLNREAFAGFSQARCEASRLYRLCAELYLQKHEEKKLHDPTALVCHLHPEVGVWYRGAPIRRGSGWTTEPGTDFVLADVYRNHLWHHLRNWM